MFDDVFIAPSILACDLCNLASELKEVDTADYLHFDVMDGNFVPNTSFGLAVLDHTVKASPIPVDVHLMIANPDEMAVRYAKTGANIVTFHVEATNHAHRLVGALRNEGVKVGIALNPATPVSVLDPIIKEVDLVLIMTVNPGFGGQKFIETSYRKLKQVRALAQELGVNPLVEVDGGIDATNAQQVVEAGANVLVAGSSVYGKADRTQAIEAIREAGRKGISRSV